MGLPIWRDPEEEKHPARDAAKSDPTATARSSIRRRPSVHGRRSARPRLARDATTPRFVRSPPPSVAVSGLPHARRATPRGLPPPVPESRNYYGAASLLEERGRVLGESILRLTERAGQIERHAQPLRPWNPADSTSDDNEPGARPAMRHARGDRDPVLARSPEPMSALDSASHGAPQSRSLPTPPADASEADADALFLPVVRVRSRGSHPLRHSWSPDSPMDGLGDRDRSPTPADGWEVIRSTIAPDAHLPSAESSFASAAASQSFASNTDTNITEPEPASRPGSSGGRRRDSHDSSQSDSVSSIDPDDLVYEDEHSDQFAEDMWDFEMITPEGRDRIRAQERMLAAEGHRFVLDGEPDRVEIGFRLIEHALDSEEGCERLLRIGVVGRPEDVGPFGDRLAARRSSRRRRPDYRRASLGPSRRRHITDDRPPSPHPELHGEETRAAAREATARVHDFFHRFTADSLRWRSPPPEYEHVSSYPGLATLNRPFRPRDGPDRHLMSPPADGGPSEGAETALADTDLMAMRRVVERLARRDDVPDEWWSSIGLNLSRTRPRPLSPQRTERPADAAASSRLWPGRNERGNSRL